MRHICPETSPCFRLLFLLFNSEWIVITHCIINLVPIIDSSTSSFTIDGTLLHLEVLLDFFLWLLVGVIGQGFLSTGHHLRFFNATCGTILFVHLVLSLLHRLSQNRWRNDPTEWRISHPKEVAHWWEWWHVTAHRVLLSLCKAARPTHIDRTFLLHRHWVLLKIRDRRSCKWSLTWTVVSITFKSCRWRIQAFLWDTGHCGAQTTHNVWRSSERHFFLLGTQRHPRAHICGFVVSLWSVDFTISCGSCYCERYRLTFSTIHNMYLLALMREIGLTLVQRLWIAVLFKHDLCFLQFAFFLFFESVLAIELLLERLLAKLVFVVKPASTEGHLALFLRHLLLDSTLVYKLMQFVPETIL